MNDSNNATEALRRLLAAMLDEDATIRNRGEAYDNLHDHVLDACKHAGVPIEPPKPIVSKWTVEGTVHFGGGFRVTVDAKDREQAERKAEGYCRRAWDQGDTKAIEEFGIALDEVCVNGAWREEDLPDKPWIITSPTRPDLAWSNEYGWTAAGCDTFTQEEKAGGLTGIPDDGVWTKKENWRT